MAELHRVHASVLVCCAESSALDAVAIDRQVVIRVAPDEILLLGDDLAADEVAHELAVHDPGSLVLDVSDGYALWAIEGDGHRAAFARLSAVPLANPPAILQGLVAQVPAKVIVEATRVVLVVSSSVSAHLRNRIAGACADLVDARDDAPARPLHSSSTGVTA